ncbi:hypothetical protein BST81_11780 [Leptolyngbya sp. 'hensonii']|uniref:DUF3172 domain-containing protein n=1 Tax=Leptolyngbya sp. 'hensonii' TaxID=1922337 RepID=UPI00094FBE6D|nr:DUF3172 domain-containing protein [Leptolyngbya sp. 'hensonii']OLP18231.1 hypothetical protein BST81_11780 [Leptolyngbya sp. 'hensonii']
MKRRSAKSAPSRSSAASPSALANPITFAVLGGVFVLGVGLGILFSSTASSGPENIASREAIDRAAPNAELCVQFGASAIAMDTRVFITLNPFNVYVSQPKMQPACVLRQNNWAVLEQRKLVNSEQVRDCKNRMNTFAFTGNLESNPQINCIYQNDAAQNLFLNQPGVGLPPPENNQF